MIPTENKSTINMVENWLHYIKKHDEMYSKLYNLSKLYTYFRLKTNVWARERETGLKCQTNT